MCTCVAHKLHRDADTRIQDLRIFRRRANKLGRKLLSSEQDRPQDGAAPLASLKCLWFVAARWFNRTGTGEGEEEREKRMVIEQSRTYARRKVGSGVP